MTLLELFNFFEEFSLDDCFSGKNSRLDRQKKLFIDFLISRASLNESFPSSISYYIENKTRSHHENIKEVLKVILKDLTNGESPALILNRYGFISNHEKILVDQDDFNSALFLLDDFRKNQSTSITNIITKNFYDDFKYLVIFLFLIFFYNEELLSYVAFNVKNLKSISNAVIHTPIYIANKYINLLYIVLILSGFYFLVAFFHKIYKKQAQHIYKLPFKLNFKYYEDYLAIFSLLRLFIHSGRADIEVVKYLKDSHINSVITKQFNQGYEILQEGGKINEVFTKDDTPVFIKDKLDNGVLSNKQDKYYSYIIEDIKKEVNELKKIIDSKSKIFFGLFFYGFMLWICLDFYVQVQIPLTDISQMK